MMHVAYINPAETLFLLIFTVVFVYSFVRTMREISKERDQRNENRMNWLRNRPASEITLAAREAEKWAENDRMWRNVEQALNSTIGEPKPKRRGNTEYFLKAMKERDLNR